MRVLHIDNHLLFVEKPAGVPVVPDGSGDVSLLDEARSFVEQEFAKPGRAFLGVVHRLDRPVSGIVLFARTSKAAKRLTAAFRERRVRKIYLAVLPAAPPSDSGVLIQWLRKDRARNRVHAFAEEREGTKRAETHWRVLRVEPGRVLVEFRPLTGRSHQLRVAARSLGAPLLGDLRYGPGPALRDRSVALHAHALEVPHPTRAERVLVRVAPPGIATWRFRGETFEEGVSLQGA